MKIKKELDETLDLVMLACSKGIDRGEILTAFAIDVNSISYENTPTQMKKLLEE